MLSEFFKRHIGSSVVEPDMDDQLHKDKAFAPDVKFRHPGVGARLEVRHLDLSIGNQQILKDISLQIPENRITCIIGPSGCGKSTLLKSFNRLIDSVDGVRMRGSITLGEQDILRSDDAELIDLRRRIGLVPQRPCPLPMSIYDNVAYGCRIHGIRGRRKLDVVVEHYLSEVGLWDEVKERLREPANDLSIGRPCTTVFVWSFSFLTVPQSKNWLPTAV